MEQWKKEVTEHDRWHCLVCEHRIPYGAECRSQRSHYAGAGLDIVCAACYRIHEHITERVERTRPWGGDLLMRDDLRCLNISASYCGFHECRYQDVWDEPPPEHIASLAFALPGDPLPPKGAPFIAPGR